jgi:hypothetical protein
MCLLISKPQGKRIDKKLLFKAMKNNDDGAGFAVIEEENGKPELNLYKGIFDFKKFWKEFEPRQDLPAIIHFRNATQTLISGKTCHPFRVTNTADDYQLVFAHNGHILRLPDSDKTSDTNVFNEKILQPLAKVNPNFWQLPSFKWMIENAIGSGNKLVMMDNKGDVCIFNEDAGHWTDGVWFSNYSYNHSYSWSSLDTEWEMMQGGEIPDNEASDEPKSKTIDIAAEISTVEKPAVAADDFEEWEVDELEEMDKRIEDANRSRMAASSNY